VERRVGRGLGLGAEVGGGDDLGFDDVGDGVGRGEVGDGVGAGDVGAGVGAVDVGEGVGVGIGDDDSEGSGVGDAEVGLGLGDGVADGAAKAAGQNASVPATIRPGTTIRRAPAVLGRPATADVPRRNLALEMMASSI
jgi:hypothetical protein